MYDPIIFNEKVRNRAPSPSIQSQKYIKKLILSRHPDGSKTYTESLLNGESTPDGTLTAYIGSSP